MQVKAAEQGDVAMAPTRDGRTRSWDCAIPAHQ